MVGWTRSRHRPVTVSGSGPGPSRDAPLVAEADGVFDVAPEGRDAAVPGPLVQPDGVPLVDARLQTHEPRPLPTGVSFQVVEQHPAEPSPAEPRAHVHP